MNKIKSQFKQSFKWNIFGSIFYEISKVLNHVFLLKNMTSSEYGLMAAIFSGIYFVIYLSELGITQALPAFLTIFIKNQTNFKKLFLKLYLLPQILIYSFAAIIAVFFYTKSFLSSPDSPFLLIIPLTIIFEGIRIFLRRFLHNIFISKKTIILETILMSLYLITIWVPYLFFNRSITLNSIFLPYLISSIVAVIFFVVFINNFYKKLSQSEALYPKSLLSRIIKTRWLSYSSNVSKTFFTGNFLTPFFAANFGLAEAGIFNMANHIAESIKAIAKATVIFSGGGFFAKLKSAPIQIKKQAFKLLSKNLNRIIYPVLIFIIINNKFVFRLKETNITSRYVTSSTTVMALLFFVITAIEFFFMAYEQFYTVEEKVGKLFILKLMEMIMFYAVISSKIFYDPILILIGLLVVKLISFSILAINAYSIWKLKPYLNINKVIILTSILLSMVFYFFL